MVTNRLYILLLVFCAPTTTHAFPIDFNEFGPAAITESFEGLEFGRNVGKYRPGSGILVPGILGPFTFASGIELVHPVPNPIPAENEDEIGTAGINDFRVGPSVFGLDGGSVSTFAEVPFGSAFLALDGKGDNAFVEFSFPDDTFRVGAFVTASEDEIEMTVFDVDGSVLERHFIDTVSVPDWPTNFIGLENPNGIRRVTFRGDFLVLDSLTFVFVPESCSRCVFNLGIESILLGWLRFRRLD